MRKLLSVAAISAFALIGATAQASVIFSDVTYTSDSVTFTIDGELTGYADPSPARQSNLFSMTYGGDLLAGDLTSTTKNVWSQSVFDNRVIEKNGRTGGFTLDPDDYTWSRYTTSLLGAVATNRTVTLSFGRDILNTNATNASVSFFWGSGSTTDQPSLLQTVTDVNPTPVPLPASLALLLGALGVTGVFGHRRKAA